MPITLTDITPLPTPPSKASPVNFAQRADEFLGALPDLAEEFNANIAELNKITSGLDQASPIAAWSPGTTYNFPTVVAGSDGYSYRCVGTGVVGVDPVTDGGSNWVALAKPGIPVGGIIAFVGGYFTSGVNAGFTNVLGNTAAAVNALLNSTGWYVCDGAALNLAISPIFNGSGRYLPNLTDDRFVMGDAAAGGIGGDNAIAHTHTMAHTHTIVHTHWVDIANFNSGATTLTTAQMPSHTHAQNPQLREADGYAAAQTIAYRPAYPNAWVTGSTGGGGSHTHAIDPPGTTSANPSTGTSGAASTSTSSAASNTENRPKFLSAIYIMKVA